MALRNGPGSLPIEQFPRQIADLIGYLLNAVGAEHPFAGIEAMPTGSSAPDLWLLGSSAESAGFAAHFGCAFSFAHFINPERGELVMRAYVERFQPSGLVPAPRGSVAAFVICADTEDTALWLRKSRDLWTLRLAKGELGPVPTPEDADAYQYSTADRMTIEANRARSIVGTPDQVKRRLEDLASAFGVDEVVVVTICHDFDARVRSYELLAEAFALPAPA